MAVAVPSVAGKVIRKTGAGKRVFSVLKIENWFSVVLPTREQIKNMSDIF